MLEQDLGRPLRANFLKPWALKWRNICIYTTKKLKYDGGILSFINNLTDLYTKQKPGPQGFSGIVSPEGEKEKERKKKKVWTNQIQKNSGGKLIFFLNLGAL